MRKLLIKLLLKLLDQELPMRTSLSDDTRRTMLSRTYQNPAMLSYIEDRHEALIKSCFDLFVNHKVTEAHRIVGQVFELRTLHNHLKSCYNSKREERVRNAKPNHSQRGHTQSE